MPGKIFSVGGAVERKKNHHSVVLWEVYLLVVIKSPYATVNGSNSAGKRTIEIPQDESDSIGCSAYLSPLSLTDKAPAYEAGSFI